MTRKQEEILPPHPELQKLAPFGLHRPSEAMVHAQRLTEKHLAEGAAWRAEQLRNKTGE